MEQQFNLLLFYFIIKSMNAYDKALTYLKVREHSRSELERKLGEKGFAESEIENALDELEEKNFLSDSRFAESFLHSRTRKKAEGRYILSMRLLQKGLKSSLISSSLDEFLSSDEYKDAVRRDYERLMEKKGEQKARLEMLRRGISESLFQSFSLSD